MIFERIRLTNLFSYYGEQEINLGTPEAGRNVCLIRGRNGFGKTSLLNSLKLLFTGVYDEPLRRAVQRARMPSVNQYVVGTGNDWWGIVNRQARNEGNETRCAVELEWTEAQPGSRVIAERARHIKDGAWEESLTIATDMDDLKDDEAQEFLNRHLPPDYVYFFLFDGEQIQDLAEANREMQQRQVERLLGIGAIEDLRESLNSAIVRWRRDGLDSQAKANLERLEGEKRALEKEQVALDEKRTGLSQEIENCREELRRIRHRIEGMNAFVHRYDEAQLKRDQKRLQGERTEARDRLSAQLPRDIALLVNPMLVRQALERLDQILGSDTHTRARVFDTLSAWLPGSLFDASDHPDPDIRESQRDFYRNKLQRILEQEAKKPGDFPDPTFAPDPQAAVAAREQLDFYAQADELRSARAGELRRLQGITTKLRQVETDLLNVGALSAEERAGYDHYLAKRDELEQDLEEKRKQQTGLENKSTALSRNHNEVRNQMEQMVGKAHQHRITEDKIATAHRLGDLFTSLKTRRTQTQREALQKAINRHFRVLMTSHRLIALVEVDEDFGLRYLDRAGQPISMGSLSSGMKQLMATALLWALSEVSGKQVPVVVDTPLARIDSGHQEAILTHYYPNAAAQVIVLPTDAELDARKLRLISGHIYRAYRLSNPDGEHTKVQKVTVADLIGEG